MSGRALPDAYRMSHAATWGAVRTTIFPYIRVPCRDKTVRSSMWHPAIPRIERPGLPAPRSFSDKEFDNPAVQVVHRSNNFYFSILLHRGQHVTAISYCVDRALNIGFRHRIDKFIILTASVTRVLRFIHSRSDLGQETRQVSQLNVINGALDCPASCVPHNQY